MVNGVTHLAMTKPDVLSGFDKVGVCTDYIHDGKKTGIMPYDIVHQNAEPVFEYVSGWKAIETQTGSVKLSAEFSDYVSYLENHLNLKVAFVSTGPGREEILEKEFISA
jgi:adenylosuccinate synthase